jgi:hypothetical protein
MCYQRMVFDPVHLHINESCLWRSARSLNWDVWVSLCLSSDRIWMWIWFVIMCARWNCGCILWPLLVRGDATSFTAVEILHAFITVPLFVLSSRITSSLDSSRFFSARDRSQFFNSRDNRAKSDDTWGPLIFSKKFALLFLFLTIFLSSIPS